MCPGDGFWYHTKFWPIIGRTKLHQMDCKYLRYLYKTNTIVSIISAIKRAIICISTATIAEVSLFGHIIYLSGGAFFFGRGPFDGGVYTGSMLDRCMLQNTPQTSYIRVILDSGRHYGGHYEHCALNTCLHEHIFSSPYSFWGLVLTTSAILVLDY